MVAGFDGGETSGPGRAGAGGPAGPAVCRPGICAGVGATRSRAPPHPQAPGGGGRRRRLAPLGGKLEDVPTPYCSSWRRVTDWQTEGARELDSARCHPKCGEGRTQRRAGQMPGRNLNRPARLVTGSESRSPHGA